MLPPPPGVGVGAVVGVGVGAGLLLTLTLKQPLSDDQLPALSLTCRVTGFVPVEVYVWFMVGFPVVVSLEPPSPQNQRQVVIEPETFELRLKLVAVLTVAEVGEPEQEFTVGGPPGGGLQAPFVHPLAQVSI